MLLVGNWAVSVYENSHDSCIESRTSKNKATTTQGKNGLFFIFAVAFACSVAVFLL